MEYENETKEDEIISPVENIADTNISPRLLGSGLTITGGLFQTAESGQRVTIGEEDKRIDFYNEDDTLSGTISGGKTGIFHEFVFTIPAYTPTPSVKFSGSNWNFTNIQNVILNSEFVWDNSGGSYDKMLRPVSDNTWQLGRTGARMKDIKSVLINGADYGFENKWYLTESYKMGIKEEGIALVDDKNNLKLFIGETGTYVKGGNVKNLDLLPYVKTTLEQRARMDKYPELRHRKEGTKIEPIPNTKNAKIEG